MKKTALLFACLAFAGSLFAQSEKKNILKTNIISPLFRAFHLNYERAFTEKVSGQFGFLYFAGFNQGDTKFNGFGVTPEVRLYPGGKALTGFFLSLSPRYQSFKLETNYTDINGNNATDKATLSSIGAGLVLGGQWIFGDIVSLELYGGPSFNSGSVKVESGSSEDRFDTGIGNGFGFRFGVTVGIAF
ncbi:MAG: hypothetical protein OHK0045_07940 [Raineya sp.]